MSPRTTYHALAARLDQGWLVDVYELRGVSTRVDRLAATESAARNLVARTLGSDPGSFDLDLQLVLDRRRPDRTRSG